MLTEQYDLQSSVTYPELVQRAAAEGRTVAGTQCAHIFSETTQEGEAKVSFHCFLRYSLTVSFLSWNTPPARWQSSRSSVSPARSRTSLAETSVHQYLNILTMQTDLHLLFDGLNLWLE